MSEAIKTINNRLQNELWETVIWLEENSKLARKVIHTGYTFQQRLPEEGLIIKSIVVICFGFSIGIGLGMLLAYLI